MTPEEVAAAIAMLDRELGSDVAALWRTAAQRMSAAEFRDYIVRAYPTVVLPYSVAAADLGLAWYAETPTTSRGFTPTAAGVPADEQLMASARWALVAGSADTAGQLLLGSATRAMMSGLRETVVENATRERGATWARYASATACGFCRMLATRGAVYATEKAATRVVGRRQSAMALFNGDPAKTRGGQDLGSKYHDHCRCMAVPVRPGGRYEPPAYVEQWEKDYQAAAAESRAEVGHLDPATIARLMTPGGN